ncbi:hypothetical protein [Actinomadura alba]|uniref:Uncharacterized protein n=1 Tax=Actinomadura alba TaxID=406431 RepID=A0ABR7M090_9ACTN|nr:hypothetical protein [Actinomadura alba]MBC6470451.1 hypothetical protein [Actinomadura alba]
MSAHTTQQTAPPPPAEGAAGEPPAVLPVPPAPVLVVLGTEDAPACSDGICLS